MDIKSLTAKKVAGIPVAYLVLGVVVIALYGALKLKPSAPADTTGDTTPPPDTTGDAPDTSQPVFLATPTIMQPSGVQSSVSSTPMADTDELWKRRAIDWLRQNGYTLDVATSAITKYLNGELLTAQEARARDAAVGQFGIPPESVPGTATEPMPPTVIPTTPNYNGSATRQGTPPTVHVVKGKNDDTYGELALLYYGRHGAGGVNNLIHSWNPTLNQPFPVGTRVTIPRYEPAEWYRANAAHRTAADIARKNGTNVVRIKRLNPDLRFPVRIGTRVRVR